MKKILLIPNKNKDKNLEVSTSVARLLANGGASVYVEEKYETELSGYAEPLAKVPEDLELIIVIGGDGSVLDASRLAIENELPILGVNLGKLGYLAELDVDNIDMLNRLFTGDYAVEDKMLLEVSRVSEGEVFTSERLAVNDIIISHDTFLGIADFKLEKSDGECVRYRADGMIFSTPVGSTAYSLSAGGPVIDSRVKCICITPICPHSLTLRPIVFPDNSIIDIKYPTQREKKLYLTIDGRKNVELYFGDKVSITKSNRVPQLIRLKKHSFYTKLQNKLGSIGN
jgi:NAD+ kinase